MVESEKFRNIVRKGRIPIPAGVKRKLGLKDKEVLDVEVSRVESQDESPIE